MTAEPQTSFGPYRVKSRIGKGGMGEVYLAEDPRLQREVAIKTLPESHALDPARRARFLTEARAASAQVTFFAESNLLDGRYLLYSRRSASSDVWIARFEHPERRVTSRPSE